MREARNIADIARLEPDFMGFIFYERSPRFAGGMEAASLDVIPPTVGRVGVFVDASEAYIRETARKFNLGFVQLHGAEPPGLCARLRGEFGIIKAFGIGSARDLARTADYDGVCDYYLFDTLTAAHGGSGRRFDHTILASYGGCTPYIISGGLCADDAVRLAPSGDVRCVGLDINSRFESAPGVKDPARVGKFIETIKNI